MADRGAMEDENNTAALTEDYKRYLMETPREALSKSERKLKTKLVARNMMLKMGLATPANAPNVPIPTKKAKKHRATMQKVHGKLATVRRLAAMTGEAQRRAVIKHRKFLAALKKAHGPVTGKMKHKKERQPPLSRETRRATRARAVETRRRRHLSAIREENNENMQALTRGIAATTMKNSRNSNSSNASHKSV